jgi:hypothetical protein
MAITRINLNLDNLTCNSTSIGPFGDELQIVSELFDATTAQRVSLHKEAWVHTFQSGESVSSKVLWTFTIPPTWGVTAPWPDKLELDITINKIESFLQAQPIAQPPQPQPQGQPAAPPTQMHLTTPIGTVSFDPLAWIKAAANAPKQLLKLALESQLAFYAEPVDGKGIQQMQAQGGDIFQHAFNDKTPKQGKFGAYGSDFTIKYDLVAA